MIDRIEIFEGKDGQFYYVVVAKNGETLSTSEAYTRLADAERAATTAYPEFTVIQKP